MKQIQRLLLALMLLASMICLSHPSAADTRVALVIGNGAYRNVPRLPNPANDASAVASALKRAGFQVILATDLTKAGMDDTTITFARAARNADVAMFYYSGHAMQFGGVNYLAPIDANLADEADLRRMTRVDEVVADLALAKNLRILVLDSCRDNPLADQLKRSIGTTRALSAPRGLAKIDAPPEGMIVAYATQAGRTAEDGTGKNSPYTAAFLKHIDEKDEIGAIFRRVSSDVYETTKRSQLPELSLSVIGEFYLNGRPDIVVKSEDSVSRDFEAAGRIDTVSAWDAFLKQHPTGFYASLAQELRAKAAGKSQVAAVTPAIAPPPAVTSAMPPAISAVAPPQRPAVAAAPTPAAGPAPAQPSAVASPAAPPTDTKVASLAPEQDNSRPGTSLWSKVARSANALECEQLTHQEWLYVESNDAVRALKFCTDAMRETPNVRHFVTASALAALTASDVYQTGAKGVKRDQTEATKWRQQGLAWFEQAANAGDVEAMTLLAKIYSGGWWHVKANKKLADKWNNLSNPTP